jgi:hypothetical protein
MKPFRRVTSVLGQGRGDKKEEKQSEKRKKKKKKPNGR